MENYVVASIERLGSPHSPLNGVYLVSVWRCKNHLKKLLVQKPQRFRSNGIRVPPEEWQVIYQNGEYLVQ